MDETLRTFILHQYILEPTVPYDLHVDFLYYIIILYSFFHHRKWKLKRIDEIHQETGSVTSDNDEYGDFLNDLEEDTELRQHINVYKDTRKTAVDIESEADDNEIPQITLAEMLDDMVLEKNESSME